MNTPRLDHNDDLIEMDEAGEISHINHLAEFEEKVWPLYAGHHITKGEAFIAWHMIGLTGVLREVRDLLSEEAL